MQTKNVDATREYRLGAHELGHLFAGDHDLAGAASYGWCYGLYVQRYTLMKDSALCRVNQFTGWANSYNIHHNAYRIRWCVDYNGFCDEVNVPDID